MEVNGHLSLGAGSLAGIPSIADMAIAFVAPPLANMAEVLQAIQLGDQTLSADLDQANSELVAYLIVDDGLQTHEASVIVGN